jgi:hypothetical protein
MVGLIEVAPVEALVVLGFAHGEYAMKRLPLIAVAGILLWTAALRGEEATELARLIDRQVLAGLDTAGLKSAPPADDAEFLRRAFLDLHGVVPAAERVPQFLNSNEPHKRTQLIDELLASTRYGEHFADLWRGRLISPLVNEERARTEQFAAWLSERFNRNDGWNVIARELLTATGKIEDNPAVIYLIEGRNPLGVTDLTDLTSRYFLGVRLNCAQCHDHPFVAWKRRDYWGMAAFFAQIQTPQRAKLVYMVGVQDNPKFTLATLPAADAIDGYQPQLPTFLGGAELKADGKQPLRVALADWMTSPDNPYFARAAVNRLWWHFFGRGLVNPVDDMHSGNAPSHPELLNLLSQRFVTSGYDLKLLCRAIATSRTYQQTSRPGEQGDAEAKLFGRMPVKVLTAEQLYDSLVEILGPPAKSAGIDARLGQRYEFAQFFSGDDSGDPTSYPRGIPHLLRLMNSPQFAGRNVSSLVSKTIAGRTTDEAANGLFVTILARRPTAAERELVQQQAASADSPQSAYRELAWALLMSSEFALNH